MKDGRHVGILAWREVDRLPVSSLARHVYNRLCRYANANGVCWPGEATLARDLRVSVRHVRRGLAELFEHGIIRIEPRYRRSNRVVIDLNRILAFPAPEREEESEESRDIGVRSQERTALGMRTRVSGFRRVTVAKRATNLDTGAEVGTRPSQDLDTGVLKLGHGCPPEGLTEGHNEGDTPARRRGAAASSLSMREIGA
jgi:hypothetical protein